MGERCYNDGQVTGPRAAEGRGGCRPEMTRGSRV